MTHRLRARTPRGEPRSPRLTTDPEILAGMLEDAAHFPGGRAAGAVFPSSEAEVAAALRSAPAVLPIGAQSSLTGGATPMGELIVATARLNRIVSVGRDEAVVEPGVTLVELDAALAREGRYYPPAPTFTGAFVGGTAATNAAGAATFKYGATRDWIAALTVVLPDGDVLDVRRGETAAHPDGFFELALARGTIRVEIPGYRVPRLQKVSAGYFAAPRMDLIDLFIGSEGTLGVITSVTLRIVADRPATCLVLAPFPDRRAAMRVVARCREATRETWRTGDPDGVDICAIEDMDRRCLELLREDGSDRANGVVLDPGAASALLVTMELPRSLTAERAYDEIGRSRDADAPDTPLVRFCRMLDEAGVLDAADIAVPGDASRAAQLLAIREAVPEAVNRRVGLAKLNVDPRIAKTAADMIVPVERFEELLAFYDAEFARRGLDAAVWGHVSDGNVHPNVIPRSYADVESGKEAILEFGARVIAMGGCPLAEHGVGRNPIKQQLLRLMYGDEGIDQMRTVKRAIDPAGKMAPGVLFPAL